MDSFDDLDPLFRDVSRYLRDGAYKARCDAYDVERVRLRAKEDHANVASVSSSAPQARHVPVSRFAAQEELILRSIQSMGHDPRVLPQPKTVGAAGIKAAVREKLEGKVSIFPEKGTIFNKAWDRLRARGEIADGGKQCGPPATPPNWGNGNG